MNLSISGIFAGLIFGIIGFWLMKEGKKRANIPVIFIGVLMMAYSYFTSSPLADWGIGLALCGAGHYFWNNAI